MHKPLFSLEIFPPRRDAPVSGIYNTLNGLKDVNPDFISVTYGTGKQADRTATARIAKTIRNDYTLPAVAHLTAQYLDRDDADQALNMFEDAGVSAVLALRGDRVPERVPAGVFEHASDLVSYIRLTRPEMKIFAACYPEGHPQSRDLDEDTDHLKMKVEAGASHLISQLFYDNDDFFRFADKARAAGIAVPIEAGIMPVSNEKQVRHMAKTCGARVPAKLEGLLDRWGDDSPALREAGTIYACEQVADLVAHGVDGVHLYTMNKSEMTKNIWRSVHTFFTDCQGSCFVRDLPAYGLENM